MSLTAFQVSPTYTFSHIGQPVRVYKVQWSGGSLGLNRWDNDGGDSLVRLYDAPPTDDVVLSGLSYVAIMWDPPVTLPAGIYWLVFAPHGPPGTTAVFDEPLTYDLPAGLTLIPEEPMVDLNAQPIYVRHRPRMVRESVYQDLYDTLVRNEWLVGATSDGSVTTGEDDTLALLENAPMVLLDYFPESTEEGPALTALNTFAMDIGEQGQMEEGELGGFLEQPYTFNFAFYAKTDAVALAVMSDLYDRYMGMTDSPFISLYNYLESPPTLVVRMEVENFRYTRDTQGVAPHEVHLFFAALEITDYVDQARRVIG